MNFTKIKITEKNTEYQERQMLKEERVILCYHSSMYLYEGQHVPIKELVVVHQTGT